MLPCGPQGRFSRITYRMDALAPLGVGGVSLMTFTPLCEILCDLGASVVHSASSSSSQDLSLQRLANLLVKLSKKGINALFNDHGA